jgi:hypothetical protein
MESWFKFIILSLLVLLSCTSKEDNSNKNDNYQKPSTYKMVFIKDKTVSLPSESGNFRFATQYMDNGKNKYILYFDNFGDYLYVIDYDSNETKRVKLSIPHENMFKDFYAISLDSILILEYQATSTVYLTDTTGILVKKFFLGENKGSLISSEQEPLWLNNKLILSGYGIDDKSNMPGIYPICYVYDTHTAQYIPDITVDYPKFYNEHNWGWGNYRAVYSHVQDNKILYSFPASHNIYCYDITNKNVTEYNAGSSLIKEIRPFANKKEDYVPAAKIDYTKYFWENPSYFKTIYDPYSKMYYRIVGLPSEKYDVRDIHTFKKKISIAIFDSEFKFLGETLFDEKHESVLAFVNQEGLHLVYDFEPTKKIQYKIYQANAIK